MTFKKFNSSGKLRSKLLSNEVRIKPPFYLIVFLFRETMEEYGRELEKLSYKLLELISLSLGLSSHKFRDCFKN
jgi:hypothetical protein